MATKRNPIVAFLSAGAVVLSIVGVAVGFAFQGGPEPRRVTFILDFVPQGRHAPFYVASELGFYLEEGLDVTFVRGQGDLFAVQLVASGEALLGSAMPITIIEARSRGVPIKSVMVYEERSPLSYAAWEDSGIASPSDFVGRTYGGNPFGSANKILPVFLRSQGVDPDSIVQINVEPSALVATFLAGEFEIAPAFHDATWPIYQAQGQRTGREPVEFLLSEWGFDLLGYSVFARDSDIEGNGPIIEAFVRATIRGYLELQQSPELAVELMLNAEPTLDPDFLRAQIDNALELMETDDYGRASTEAWQNTVSIVSDAYELSGIEVTDVTSNMAP